MQRSRAAGGLAWPRINPEDRIDRSNLGEHNIMIDSINANADLADRAYEISEQAADMANQAMSDAANAQASAAAANAKADQAIADAAQVAGDLAALESDLPRQLDLATEGQLVPVIPSPFEQTGGGVRFTERTKGGTVSVSNVPLRTPTDAGLMADEDLRMIESLDTRVQVLENTGSAGGLYYVPSNFASLTDSERDQALEGVKQSPPIIGDTVCDLQSSFWVRLASGTAPNFHWESVQHVSVPAPSGANLIISSYEDGKILVNIDGTGEVNGWSAVQTFITMLNQNLNQTIIKVGDVENEQNRQQIELSQLSGLLGGKIDKDQGAANANMIMATDSSGNFYLRTLKIASISTMILPNTWRADPQIYQIQLGGQDFALVVGRSGSLSSAPNTNRMGISIRKTSSPGVPTNESANGQSSVLEMYSTNGQIDSTAYDKYMLGYNTSATAWVGSEIGGNSICTRVVRGAFTVYTDAAPGGPPVAYITFDALQRPNQPQDDSGYVAIRIEEL